MKSRLVYDFLARLHAKNRAPVTLKIYAADLAHLCRFLLKATASEQWVGTMPPGDRRPEMTNLDKLIIGADEDSLKLWNQKMRSVNHGGMARRRCNVIRAFFFELVWHKAIPSNPASQLAPVRSMRRVLSREDAAAIMSHHDPTTRGGERDRLACLLVYHCLLRNYHCMEVRTTDVLDDLSRMVIKHPKGNIDIDIPECIRPSLRARIDRLPAGSRLLSRRSIVISNAIKKAVDSLGMWGVDADILRVAGVMDRIHAYMDKIGTRVPKHLVSKY